MAQENPYLQLVQGDLTGSVKNAMQVAADKNPDVEAKLLKLAKSANVPLEVARLDQPAVERKVAMDSLDYKTLAEKYPSTAQLLSDPISASLAKDDVPKLSFIEDSLNFGANFGRSLAASIPSASASIYGGLQAPVDVGAGLIEPLVGRILPGNPLAAISDKLGGWRKTATADAKAIEGNQADMGFIQKSALSGAKSLGQNLLMMPASVLSGNPMPMLAGMTAMTGGDAYGQARDAGVSVPGSLAFASSQAMIEYATEKLPAIYLMRDIGLKSSFKKMLFNQAVSELPGEQVATVLQDMNEWAVLHPEQPFSAYLAERPSAAAQTLIATMVATGGQIAITKATDRLANGPREKQAVDILSALKDGVLDSKTFERAPERVKDFIAKHTANGPMENIFIPAEQLQSYFQTVQIDPAAAAAEMGAKNYAEALATGGDVVIPLAEFITSTAKTPHYDGLVNDIRFVQGEMTAREADLYEKNHPDEIRKMIEDAQKTRLPDLDIAPAIKQMTDDITGQLVAGGMEQGTAESYAQTYAKVINNLAERAGMDPMALHQQYGMQIVRPMADVLTNIGTSDIQIDPLLDMLRSGQGPSAAQINGPSLIEFIRSIGGVNDAGGELRQMEVDKNKAPFVRNLAQLTGRGIDEVTALANESGYQVRDLLAAIEAEIAGNPTYSVNNINEEAQGRARDLNSLAEYLQQLGVDLATASNEDVRKAMAAAVGTSYNQQYNKEKRGYIQFGADRKFKIALLENADLSTFLHETGHFWLEVMGDLATGENASEQIKADYAAILKFLKVESREQIGVEQHEMFARANEAYLMEGKAPSPELRAVFQRFKAWLTMIYKSMEALNVKLSDEVRGVFNRIYAADAEIEAAQDELDMPALFATAQDAGMTEQEFSAYKSSIAAATARGKDELRAKLMRQFQREKLVWWNTELDKMRAEVGAEVDAQPIYRAFDALTKGELPDGTPFKLDKQGLVDQFGKAYVKKLPRGYGEGRGAVFSTDGQGIRHDAAADLLGYGSGAELVEALVNMRPRKELIEAEAKKRMVEKHGDLLTDGTIADEATAALHNEERGNILRTELMAIRRKQREVAPFVKLETDKAKEQTKQAMAATDVPPASAFRDAARGLIGQSAVRDIKPYPYLLAERKASKAAFKAMANGDHMEAATQKQRELLNHYLYLEATKAQETVDDIYTYARKFTKTKMRAKFGKAGASYLEQIDDLLDQYEFASVPNNDIVRREKLLQFIKDKMADDEPVMIPDSVLLDAQKRNYKTLPFDQLLAVRDAIKNIEHMVDLKTKLLKIQAKRALEEVVNEGAASIEEYGTLKQAPIGTRTWLDSVKEIRDGYFAAHRKIASLFREMDGWKDDGFMWNTFMKPINDAATDKAVRTEDATKKLMALYSKLQKPGLGNKLKGLGLLTKEYYPSLGRSLSKSDILALALNYGNEGNRQRIRDGYGWTDQQVLAALNKLEDNEWDFVQGTWDLIDSYWPEISAQDKRINGIEPAKVERSGFVLPNGRTVDGGYYPIKYDERHSVRSYTDRAKEEADRIMRGAVARPGVDTGFTEARAGKVIDRKIKLDLGVGLAHIDTVLQTLTHREMLIDINKILGSPKINGAILEHYGIETYKAIQEAIVDIAAGEIGAQDAFEKGMGWLRSGVTVAGLGLNITTAFMQPLGITQSMVRIGPKWAARGVARFIGDAVHMENSAKFVYEKSDMMRLRSVTQSREISEIRNKISNGGVMPAVEEAYFYAIVKMQAAVDIPTWLGAYEKYMEQTGNDEPKAIALANQAVVDAQGGGETKDLASIQRGGPLKKLFTTFYSYFSALWNLSVESASRTDFKKVGDVGRFAVDMLLLYTIPVVLTAMLKEAVSGKGGPDDDEEWYLWLAKEQLSFMAGSLVGLREISSAIQGMYGYSGPAGTRFFSEASKLIKQAGQGEADAALMKAANNTAGILFHYPAGQLQRTVEGFMALQDGTTRNPAALLFGPPKDN